MASVFTQAGAAPEPSSYAALLTNRMMTGLWTNRSALRDAATSYLLERGGGGRQDSIWDGLNTELTSRLTLMRRPGHTVYNSQSFPAINRFYEFHLFSSNAEDIRVMVDTAGAVYDGTGPSGKVNIWNKAAGAGSSTFLGVGNSLFFFDGLEAKKWLQSLVIWTAGKQVALGTYLIDPAGNVQQATTAGVSGSGPTAFAPTLGGTWSDGSVVWTNRGAQTQTMQPTAPAAAPSITQAGTPQTIPSWAARTYYSTSYLIQTSAGTIFKATVFGTTGTNEPAWNNTAGATTADNTVIWTSQGAGAYLSSHTYATGAYIAAADGNGDLYFFQATTGGTTAAGPPSFPAALGAVVTDGTVIWTNVGVQASWGSITGTSLVGNFGVIPVQGGGRVCIGCGGGTPGSYIALPTGFTAERMVTWATPGATNGPAQVSGVYESNATGGALTSQWRNRSGGVAFAAFTNWIAAAWTSDATVTVSSSLGITYVSFTTANGDQLAIACGRMAAGTLAAPAGFLAADSVAIAGMATTGDSEGNGMQVEICNFDGSLNLTAHYRDSDGHVWPGQANVFAVFYATGSGVDVVSVTNGTAITIPTALGSSVALVMASGASGQTFGVPAGFNTFHATASMRDQYDDPSDHISHGTLQCGVAGNVMQARYTDGSGNQWNATANVFAVAAFQSQTTVTATQTIEDVNGGLQKVIVSGVSGASAPLWQVAQGALTVDNAVTWLLNGTTTIASTGAWLYWYDFQNAVDRATSTASPASSSLTLAAGYYGLLQGAYSTDPQVHTVRLFRTVQGGATPLLLATLPNNPAGGTWSYQDTTQDKDLNEFIQAAIDDQLDPPPTGAAAPAYHLQRVFIAVENTVQWSEGAAAVVFNANGSTGFPPLNSITFPSRVVRMWPCPLGLVVFTVASSYLILGTATATDPLYAVPFLDGVGLLSYDAFATQGTTAYLLTNSKQLLSLDPSAGKVEVGFPIADQIDALYSESSHLTWHSQSSADTALYAGDGFYGWHRMSPTTAPETGFAWSPRAILNQGCRALSSVQVSPGQNRLLCGQSTSGPILMRDASVRTDNGTTYSAWTVFGSIVIAQPGEVGNLRFFTLDGLRVGKRPRVGLLLGEIDGTFEWLQRNRQDPPLLPPSATLYNDRYYVAQNQQPAWCRHFQMCVDFGDAADANELLAFTVFGGVFAEMKGGV